jgi:hypothetical protein
MSDYCAIIRSVNNHTFIFYLPLYIEFSDFQIQAKKFNLVMCHMFRHSLKGKPAFGSSRHKKIRSIPLSEPDGFEIQIKEIIRLIFVSSRI